MKQGPIIYNETNKVSITIHDRWLQWLKEVHIPAILNTGYFYHAMILKLKHQDTTEGYTYAVQYHAASIHAYEQFEYTFQKRLQQEMYSAWGDDCIGFNTVLEVVN